MAERTSIMNKLAWRAKWRKRIQKWKTVIFVAVLAFIIVPTFLIFTPWFPNKVYEYIDNSKTSEVSPDILKSSAVRDMFRLGMFYSLTMRENPEGNHCYLTIIKWHRGVDIEKEWHGTPQEPIEPFIFPEDVDEYVGFALIEYARYCRLHQREMMAAALYKMYIEDYSEVEGADPKHLVEADQYIHS